MIDLSGKIVLIAGASGGIGREVARYFADCGCDVALGFHTREAPARSAFDHALTLGRRALINQVDTSDIAAARAWVNEVIATLGHIDVLVSCTGAPLPEGFSLFAKQDPSTWRGMIEGQLLSFIYLCRPVIEHMLERRSGRVIALSSDGGKVGESGTAVVNAGNAGLIGFAKSLAREVGRSGITANVVCPGPIDGPTLDALRSGGDTGARIVDEMVRRVPMKRLGRATDIAATMAFLASDEAAYITGQAISVSGGLVMN